MGSERLFGEYGFRFANDHRGGQYSSSTGNDTVGHLNGGVAISPQTAIAASDACDPTVTTTGLPTEDNAGLNAPGLVILSARGK
ncbi:MAG: hypothetical protein R2825_27890 [Saprospiraceae bacterium]